MQSSVITFYYFLGNIGYRGLKGDRGLTGDLGTDGLPGPVGYPGEKGDFGQAGPPGPPGYHGDKGDTGPKGPTGKAFTYICNRNFCDLLKEQVRKKKSNIIYASRVEEASVFLEVDK